MYFFQSQKRYRGIYSKESERRLENKNGALTDTFLIIKVETGHAEINKENTTKQLLIH